MTDLATPARRSARKAKGDGHLRRAEILDAAERIFMAEGYEGATIRKIADEVGVSSTALYMHFPDKAAILLEICEATFQQLADRNVEIAARPIDPVIRVRMILEAYMRWGFEHPNAYALVYSRRPSAATLYSETTAAVGGRSYDAFAGVVSEIAAQGRLRTGTDHVAAQALWMACHGVVALMTSLPDFRWSGDREQMMAVTLDGLLHGMVID